MKISAYIITKPLQYINVTNIDDENHKDLYIVPNFNYSFNFINSIKLNSNRWRKIKTFKTKEKSLLYILIYNNIYSNIYLDSDFGILLRLILIFFPNTKIFVYEEGIASYTKDIRSLNGAKSLFLKFIDNIMFGGNWSGGSRFINGIYLYKPDAFRKILKNDIGDKNLLNFNKNYIDHIKDLKEIKYLFNHIDYKKYENKNVLIYLSAGAVNLNVYPILDKYPLYYKILKLHPNEKEFTQSLNHFNESLNNSLPAEVLITNLLSVTKNLIVIHESSAAILNIITNFDLIEYNIANKDYKKKFEELVLLFKS